VSDFLSAATGRGVRVAVIDSGVHAGHPHIDAARLLGGVGVARDGTIEDDAQSMLDRLGHGTAVTAAIQERAVGADILTVRVFRDALRASAAALIAAIDWCIDTGADVVNLSLGSVNAAHRDAFAQAADRAAEAGVLLVAARAAGEAPCWPGALPSVLGVELDWDCPRGSYRVAWQDGVPTFAAPGYPRPIDGVPPARNLYGVSFAVAQMSGFAAMACQRLREAATAPADLTAELPRFLAGIESPASLR
jgi:subtilisin family serine protease